MKNIKLYHPKKPFLLENGQYIQDLKIAYHTYGKLNADASNVIWVFHAISANSDVLDWWHGLFGEGAYYDPSKYFIICANAIGSPYGSSCPEDQKFPQFSMRDVVGAHSLLAQHLKIDKIHTAIGGSFGGNQALEFAYSFSGRIDQLILIASCARESAWGIAIHESQRLAMESDSSLGSFDGGRKGMKAARSMAMLTYRTSDSFIAQQSDAEEKTDDFNASSYVRYQGEKFAKRFNALSYYYLTKCLDSHNIGRGRDGEQAALSRIAIPTLVIGIDTDTLIPVRAQKFMAEHLAEAYYTEIHSDFGHDGFLIETDSITQAIVDFHARIQVTKKLVKRVVLKFGGSSLVNNNLENVIQIIERAALKNPIAVVVSSRGNSTNALIDLYKAALRQEDISDNLERFFESQKVEGVTIDLSKERKELKVLLQAIQYLKLDDTQFLDRVMAYGEWISAQTMTALLNAKGRNAITVDSSEILKLDANGEIESRISEQLTAEKFSTFSAESIPVVTGFYGADAEGKTRTLGRNGTNYSATLIAAFIKAIEVQNWTDVNGIYSADPRFVHDANPIEHLSYKEANELASFGVNVLHAKTILPLINSHIPLRVLNTSMPESPGTVIDQTGSGKGIKAVSVIEHVSLVQITGKGLYGRIGIDARIFSVLSKHDISVRIISQASSERGIGFVIDTEFAHLAESLLHAEFEKELIEGEISAISVDKEMAIIAILGRHNYALEKAIHGLRKNKIWMHLISNSISGEHISLVIDGRYVKKAMRVVHGQVFGATKVINVFAIGKGTVGGAAIDQIIETHSELERERNIHVRVIGVADSQRHIICEKGLQRGWRKELAASSATRSFESVLKALQESGLENLVIADNSSSLALTQLYPEIIKAGFDLVASNKKGNSISQKFYSDLRDLLKRRGRFFYYETNVGAGLPVIDTLKHLRLSADKVTRIRGVFSGSLSYIFNTYSDTDIPFSHVLLDAKEKGFTEPDPREDLSGMDVARKLVILARETGMNVEFEDVKILGLIPEQLKDAKNVESFFAGSDLLNHHFSALKKELKQDEVLRFVGDLDVNNALLTVSLEKISRSSPLGGLKNADSLFEIFTTSYGEHPMVIQGAGAGAEVTARGVYSDILRIGAQL